MSITTVEKLRHRIWPYYTNPQNANFVFDEDLIDKPIYGFYHIYAANNWKEIFISQLDRLQKSDLLGHTTRLFISIIGNEADRKFVEDRVGPKGKVIWQGTDKTAFEFPALRQLYNLSLCEDFYCYYFHTKGSSNSTETVPLYKNRGVTSLKQLRRNHQLWRQMMEYWSFDRWQLALATLRSGFDTYGAIYRNYSNDCKYYGGNFWWSKSQYVVTRDYSAIESPQSRYVAETWIMSSESSNVAYMFDNQAIVNRGGYNHYNAFTVFPDSNGVPLLKGLYDPTDKLDALLSRIKYTTAYFAVTAKLIFTKLRH